MSRRLRRLVGSSGSNLWSVWVVRRLHYLHALAISLGLTMILAGCSADAPDQGPADPIAPETGGVAGGASSSGGAAATGPAAAGGRTAARGGATPTSSGASGAVGQSTSAASCPTYEDDFLPQINTPVCSNCHKGGARVADWGVYSQAKANCTTIGSRVASGAMPPARSGYTLSAAQRSLVASWVRLGCPETMSDLPSTCP